MHLPLSSEIAPQLELIAEIGSTNDELVARATADQLPDFTVLATTRQTAGKGRLGRVWIAPPDKTIAVSVLLQPGPAPQNALGWLPLLAGLAMTRAVTTLVRQGTVSLKWPNDVHIDGLKVAGILAELVPTRGAVVVGAGLNLTIGSDELPTEVSTSLSLNGVAEDNIVDAALSNYLAELEKLYSAYLASGLDATSSGLASAVSKACGTVGRSVRVDLPGGAQLFGTAEGIDELGRLQVRALDDGRLQPVAAGDVTHLRYE